MAFDDVISGLADRRDVEDYPDGYVSVTQLGTVAVDASLQETHTSTGEATDHMVEEGGDITDNYRVLPRRFSIEGVVSNHPINLPASQVDGVEEVPKEFTWEATPKIFGMQLGGAGLLGTAVDTIASATGVNVQTGTAKGYSPDFDRVQDCYDELDVMMERREPFDVITTLRVYGSMVFESLTVTRDKHTGHALRFSGALKQIRTVTTEFTAAPPRPLVERGKPTANLGKQSAKKLDEGGALDKGKANSAKESAQPSSFLYGGLIE